MIAKRSSGSHKRWIRVSDRVQTPKHASGGIQETKRTHGRRFQKATTEVTIIPILFKRCVLHTNGKEEPGCVFGDTSPMQWLEVIAMSTSAEQRNGCTAALATMNEIQRCILFKSSTYLNYSNLVLFSDHVPLFKTLNVTYESVMLRVLG